MGGFDVVITGFKLNGRDTPARVLERVLGEPPDSAKALTRSFPAVVRRCLSPVEADPLVLALRAAGARVELRPTGSGPEAAAPVRQSAAPTARAMAGLIASQPAPSGVPSPAEQSFKLGTLRIETPAAEKKTTGKFILGTLKIMLKGPPAPPPPQPDFVITPAAPAADPEALLHATGMRDDAFDDLGSQRPLELDTDALEQRSNFVSGGRRDAAHRPSLMNLVRESLVDIPLRVVRRSRATEPSTGLVSAPRVPYLWHGFVGVGIVIILCLSFALANKGDGEVAAAQDGAPPPLPGAAAQTARTTQAIEEDAPKLHPILQLVPEPMEPALANILRKQVAGTHSVRIDWGEDGPPEDDRVSCVVVSGSAVQREERVRALLATGRRYPTTPSLESQMRDHMEVLRMADNDAKAQYTPLCLGN
jgi:hypothetical protein